MTPQNDTTPNAIECRDLTKRFGQVLANDKVCLTVRKGEILSLLGENGSGKTTLMNMLSGIYYPDGGEILVDGVPVAIRSPKDAFALGIGMVHQHFKLIHIFTAAENIALGLGEKGRYDIRAVAARVRQICEKYGFELDPDKKIYDMSVSEKQTVEIVKVLYRGAQTLILDEPTAVLTPQETEKLFAVLRNMKADGKAVVIITHKLREVLEISDRVSVLRKGCYVGTVPTREADAAGLTEMMVGQKVDLQLKRAEPRDRAPRLVLKGVSALNSEGVKALDDIDLTVFSGEILGVAGVAGSGQKELLEAIAGLQPVTQGSICYDDIRTGAAEELRGRTPLEIRRLGVHLSFVPEDRLGMGLVGSMGMTGNVMLRSYRDGRGFFTDRRGPKELAQALKEQLGIVTPNIQYPVRRLSGGNLQKVLVGREIAAAPTVLMAAYPVRGLDISSSYTIYDLLNQQKEKGVAVIYVGEDLDVMLQLCDRIAVLCGGRLTGVVDGRKATKAQVGMLMTRQEGEGT